MKYPTPYQKIVRAFKKGHGTQLSWDDVKQLMMDTAITDRADLDDSREEGETEEEMIY